MTFRTMEERTGLKEKDLQALFCRWDTAGKEIAGRPVSLAFDSSRARAERPHRAWGEACRADVFVEADHQGESLVIELKLAAKYEPLGIAEVLFHAECLSTPARAVRPVLVSQYNLWNRLTLARLNRVAGRPVLDYYEVSAIEVGEDACFWFDAPLAAWRPAKAPPSFLVDHARSLSEWLGGSVSWFEVPETRSFVATALPRDAPRPTVIETPYLMAAPIDDRSGTYLVWAGAPPARNATENTWNHSQYWIADPS